MAGPPPTPDLLETPPPPVVPLGTGLTLGGGGYKGVCVWFDWATLHGPATHTLNRPQGPSHDATGAFSADGKRQSAACASASDALCVPCACVLEAQALPHDPLLSIDTNPPCPRPQTRPPVDCLKRLPFRFAERNALSRGILKASASACFGVVTVLGGLACGVPVPLHRSRAFFPAFNGPHPSASCLTVPR